MHAKTTVICCSKSGETNLRHPVTVQFLAKESITAAMHHQNSLSRQRAFSICYCAYPFVCWSCFMEVHAPGNAAQAAAQPFTEKIE